MSRLPCRRKGRYAIALLSGFTAYAGAQSPSSAVLSGRVLSDQGTPLQGANVYITELNLSVGSNEAGRYTIAIAPERVRGQTVVLRVRSIGFLPESRQMTLTAGTQTADFTLKPDINRLQEVVVTGVTGATERAKVPFSVSRVDSADMPVVAVNPLSQLAGKVTGAQISGISGRPGQAPAVILRGPTSINAMGRAQGPLFIVDGVLLGSSLADINPADIESVEIVKGAAASSLYGSQAGAGVIQITTKRGKGGADGVRFNARGEYGLNDIEGDFGIARYHTFLTDETGKRFCVLDAAASSGVCSRTIDYRAEQARVNGAPGDFALSPPSFPVDPGATVSGDILRRAFLSSQWNGRVYNAVAQLVDPKPVTINDVSMSARRGSTSIFSSVGYTQQGGAIMGLEGYDRVNGRVNVGQTFGEHWSFDANSYFSRSTADGSNQEEGGTGFFRLTRTPAIVDITQRDTLGRLYIRTNLGSGGVQNENPLYSFENIERSDVRYRYLGGANVRYTPLSWLDAEGSFSIDRLNGNFAQFQNRGFRTTNSAPNTNGGLVFNGTSNSQTVNGGGQLTLRPSLFSSIATRFNGRVSYLQEDADFRRIQGLFLAVSDVNTGENATQQQSISSNSSSSRQLSFSGGANFDILDRYTVDLLVREDGNSRFGADRRWQTYGRGSLAWLISRESWFPSDKITQMTLRASVGTAGNSPNFSAQYETYSIGAGGTLSAQTLGNKNLRPEVTTEYELNTELELFSRVGLSITYARGDTKDQILPVPVAVSTGFATQWQNAGRMENTTWEASLSMPFIRRPNLTWSGRVNYTTNKTVVKELSVPAFNIGPGVQAAGQMILIEEGKRYGTIVGRKFLTSCAELPASYRSQCGSATSAFQRNDEGYIVWVGEGNNPRMGITDNLWNAFLPASVAPWGVKTSWGMPIILRDDLGTGQQVDLGHALPDYRIGVSNTFSYKRLALYGLLEGAFGQSIWNQGRHWSYLDFLSHDVDQGGKSIEAAKPIGYYYRAPAPDNGSGIGGFYDILAPNNRFVEDASYMKLRELSASYHFGRLAGGGDWSVSVIGRNLFTITDYTGFDPETGVSGGQSNSGLINAVDAFTFPNLRTLSFVVSTSF